MRRWPAAVILALALGAACGGGAGGTASTSTGSASAAAGTGGSSTGGRTGTTAATSAGSAGGGTSASTSASSSGGGKPVGPSGFLIPPPSQTLYTGTAYVVLAEAVGATQAAVADSHGAALACALDASTGLVTCTYAPAVSGPVALSLTASATGGAPVTASLPLTVAVPSGMYPQGDRLMLGAYDGDDDSSDPFATFAASGFNVSQEYCSDCSTPERQAYIEGFADAGGLGGPEYLDQPLCTTDVASCESTALSPLFGVPEALFWGLPEEESDPRSYDQAYFAYLRANDPSLRPVFKYMATNAEPSNLIPVIAFEDLVGTGAYPIYEAACGTPILPPVFARYVVENELSAIADAGFTIGPDYVSGQKTPLLIPETEPPGTYCTGAAATTPDSYANQVWNGLAAGAQGIFDYEYAPMVTAGVSGFTGPTGVFGQVNALLEGPDAVAEWLLKGVRQPDPQVAISSGDATVSYAGNGYTFSYPSVRAAAWDWAGERLIVAVNADSASVSAAVSGLPQGTPSAAVVGEGRSVELVDGGFSETFSALETHLYKLPLVQGSDGGWSSL